MVAEQALSERAEHVAWIAQLEGDLYELMGQLHFLEYQNSVADLRYSILSDECDSLKRQIASG